MFALVAALVLSAPPSARLVYEQKCLYCHSEEVAERPRLTEAAWRRRVEQERLRAPLLITRSDVPLLTRFIARELNLAVAPKAPLKLPPTPTPPERVSLTPADAGVAQPVSVARLTEDLVELLPEPTAEESALAEEGFSLMQRRCSRCHTLGRVYGKLDSLERSLAVVERMSLKTGAGITEDDLKTLDAYLRSQFVK
jgi:cytochrome c5